MDEKILKSLLQTLVFLYSDHLSDDTARDLLVKVNQVFEEDK